MSSNILHSLHNPIFDSLGWYPFGKDIDFIYDNDVLLIPHKSREPGQEKYKPSHDIKILCIEYEALLRAERVFKIEYINNKHKKRANGI